MKRSTIRFIIIVFTPLLLSAVFFQREVGALLHTFLPGKTIKNPPGPKTSGGGNLIEDVAKVPEGPQTQPDVPTKFKKWEPSTPAEGIVSIAPPMANNSGAMGFSMALKLPPGRQDMVPTLLLRYSSDGGSNWTGWGFDLSFPTITIDTRWGVPRYDPDLETEIYLLNGEQLHEVAHRGALKPRQGEKRFFPRVEAAFQRIIRHGDAPDNYWWEVASKNGTRHFYGGTPGGGIENNAVMRDQHGHIGHWALVEDRDLNENFVRYHYEKVSKTGLPNGKVPGQQLYISKITYTGHGQKEGPFSIVFQRDADRKDIQIKCNLGFKQVSTDRLRQVDILYNDAPVTSYTFDYKEGAFFKTLLASVVEKDRLGQAFTRHDFDYYDEVRKNGTYQPFKSEQDWKSPSDGLNGGLLIDYLGFDDDAGLLGASRSTSWGVSCAITVGPPGSSTCKTWSVGGNFAFNGASGDGLTALVDIDGDGLPDKLFRQDGKLKYRKNIYISTGELAFSDKIYEIKGITQFSTYKTRGNIKGVEANLAYFFVGHTWSKSQTITDTYFGDFNADRLIDIAHKGRVYFNHIDPDTGTPVFTLNSSDTPSAIVAGAGIDTTLVTVSAGELDTLIDENPLHDIVRFWQAPFDGVVNIEAPVELIQDNGQDAQDYTQKDGVRTTIQINNNEYWMGEIPTAMAGVALIPSVPSGLPVKKGDRIYFRVKSIFDGAYDRVHWDPQITYLNIPDNERNSNAQKSASYRASQDFILTAPQSVAMPLKGKVYISGTYKKQITSDDVRLEVAKKMPTGTELILFSRNYGWQETIVENIEGSFDVDSLEELSFRLVTSTNIDWQAISWKPSFRYTEFANGMNAKDPSGKYVFEFAPAVDFSMFNDQQARANIWVAPDTGIIKLSPFYLSNTLKLPEGTVTLSAKGVRKLYGKSTYTVINGHIQGNAFSALVNRGDTVFVEYHIKNASLDQKTWLVDSILEHVTPLLTNDIPAAIEFNGDSEILNAGVFSQIKDPWLGPRYRQWGFFAYNGNRQRADEKIHTNELDDPPLSNPGSGIPDKDSDIDPKYDPINVKVVMLYPDCKTNAWMGFDNLTYVGADTMSASRLGEDNLKIDYAAAEGTGATAPRKITRVKSKNLAIGLATGFVNATSTSSEGETKIMYMVIDMNGDGYPDYLSPDKCQYTTMLGGLEEKAITHNLGTQEGKSNNDGVSSSGSIPEAKAAREPKNQSSPNNTAPAKCNNSNNQNTDGQKSAKTSMGLSASVGGGKDESLSTWLDINGDGLPDKIYRNGMVALNLGYSFSAPEDWGFEGIQTGENEDVSGGATLGLSYHNGSIMAGGSISKSFNNATLILQDVNGDGLTDMLFRHNFSGQVYAKINYGNGFSPQILWAGVESLDKGVSTAESVNAAFTVCINLFFFRICFNPGGNIGRGVNSQVTQLTDIDGDGNQDFLISDKDGQLRVKLSSIGKTNLLKSVKHPMGSSFTVDYKREGNSYDMPQSKWVMASLDLYDGFNGDGPSHQKWAFEYENPFFDRHEREFYGFKTVTTKQLDTGNNDAVYRVNQSTHNTSNYYEKGLLLSETLSDTNGKIYTETHQQYALKDIFTGVEFPANQPPPPGATAFPALLKTETSFYEGQNTGLSTVKTYEYDLWGNIIDLVDHGDGSPDDYLRASIEYHAEQGSNHNVAEPKSIEVYIGANATLKRKRQTEMDANGNITQIRQYLENDEAAVFDIEYDVYGNRTKITRPPNAKGQRMFYKYWFDTDIHTYITEVSNANGYHSKSTYDPRYGKLLESIDINGQKTRYTLNERGLVETVTGPYELAAGKPYTLSFEYHPEAVVPYAITRHYDAENDKDIMTVTFTDGLGRPIQIKKTGIIGETEQKVMIVSGRVVLDAFGRALATYYPVSEPRGNETKFNQAFDQEKPITSTFDILDRVIKKTLPDGASTIIHYSISPDNTGVPCFKTTVTDALNHIKETFVDIKDRQRANKATGPNGDIWTTFKYNALSELLTVTDDGGNITSYKYDNLGRKKSIHHPVKGLTEIGYDLIGNPTKKITANIRKNTPNDSIKYTYDYERLVQIDYPTNFQNKIQYHYGDSTAEHNRIGRLYLTEDASGGQELFFGPLGETTKVIRSVIVKDRWVTTYVFENQYDTWNRIQKMIYPDGEEVDYGYNEAGQLRQVGSKKGRHDYKLVNKLTYDKFGQRELLEFGNGTIARYEYEPQRRRLRKMTATAPDGRLIMDNTYVYDAMDNVISLTNAKPIVTLGLGGPSMHSYEYDNLYRLIRASGNWTGFNKAQSYTLEMEYDNLGNILRKKQRNLFSQTEIGETTYDNPYEYATNDFLPTKIGGREYTYDANGNQTGWKEDLYFAQRELTWDEEDRLQSVWNNGQLNINTFDASGERVLKSHGSVSATFANGEAAGFLNHFDNWTAYISPYFVVQEKQFTKHYFIENQRVASRQGSGNFSHPRIKSPTITAGNLDYSKRIHLLELAAARGTSAGSSAGAYTNLDGWPKGPVPTPDFSNPPEDLITYGPDITNDNVKPGFNFKDLDVFHPESNQYFFHANHLGSTSYVTDVQGRIRQHTEYLPFGEIFVEESVQEGAQNYLFNAKELDRETGFYYYGARFYDPRLSIWLSADPLAEKYPGWSPYNYTLLNPVKYVDPDGRVTILAGALIGGVIGASASFMLSGGTFEDRMAAAGKGAIGGIASGLVAGTGVGLVSGLKGLSAVIGSAAIGATSGAVSELSKQTYEYGALDSRQSFSVEQIGESALKSAILGPILDKVKGSAELKLGSNTFKQSLSSLSKSPWFKTYGKGANGNQYYGVIDLVKPAVGLAKQIGDGIGKNLNGYLNNQPENQNHFAPDPFQSSDKPCPNCHTTPSNYQPSLYDRER